MIPEPLIARLLLMAKQPRQAYGQHTPTIHPTSGQHLALPVQVPVCNELARRAGPASLSSSSPRSAGPGLSFEKGIQTCSNLSSLMSPGSLDAIVSV